MWLTPLPKHFLKNPLHFAAFGFGSGCIAKAPGTWGTLAGLLLFIPLQQLGTLWLAALIVVSFIVGVKICESASRALGVHDHGGIVWDEIVGYWLTMLAAPDGWEWMLWGFALFRLFDIWKPWPIRWADSKVEGGFGIMLDDIIAAAYAWLGLQLTAWLL